jgi:hypothetical protein
MKDIDFKSAKKAREINEKSDKTALKIIKELRLKDKQQISDHELFTIVKAIYPDDYDLKMNILYNCKYLSTIFVVDLKDERNDNDLIADE